MSEGFDWLKGKQDNIHLRKSDVMFCRNCDLCDGYD